MFLGQAVHTIDDKNRLAIPARFRSELTTGLYLTKGVDRCLYLLTPEGWSRLADRIRALPSMQTDARRLQRHFFAGADYLVFRQDNDLVVDTESMTYHAFGPNPTLHDEKQFCRFDGASGVHHTTYFRDPKTTRFLVQSFGL